MAVVHIEQEAEFDKVVKNTVVSQDSVIVASDTKWAQKTFHIIKKLNDSDPIGFNDSSNKIITLTLSISCSILTSGHFQTNSLLLLPRGL